MQRRYVICASFVRAETAILLYVAIEKAKSAVTVSGLELHQYSHSADAREDRAGLGTVSRVWSWSQVFIIACVVVRDCVRLR